MTSKKDQAAPADADQQKGLIHLYYGDGKGKTTASVGLAARARGHNLRVLFLSFLKPGNSGELSSLRAIGVDILSGHPVTKFIFRMTEEEKQQTRRETEALFREAVAQCQQGVDLVIFDEIVGAIEMNMLDEGEVLRFLETKPQELEVVLTGRYPSPALLDAADYASEVVMRKHPYETMRLNARPGIEY